MSCIRAGGHVQGEIKGAGLGFGEYGEGFVRIGLVENEHRIRQAARNVKKFIANADEILAKAANSPGLYT